MQDIEALDMLTMNCNTIDTQSLSGQISKIETDGWGYTNKKQDAEA